MNIDTFDFIMGLVDTLVTTFSNIVSAMSGSFGDFILNANNAIADPSVSAFLDLVYLIANGLKSGGVPLADLSLLAVMVGTSVGLFIMLQIIAWVLSWIPVA